MTLIERLARIQEKVQAAQVRGGHGQQVTIIAVTKTHPVQTLIEAVEVGLNHVGENRVQEAATKFPQIPETVIPVKHLIGHLQSNKINKALTIFDRIDSVDSLSLAKKISKKLMDSGRKIPILLEVNTSGEASKSGFPPEDIDAMLACMELPGLTVEGLMTVGPLTDDETAIRQSFQHLRKLQEKLNDKRPEAVPKLTELSMGMSGDFELAVEEGSTMIRLGTALFGPRRQYP